MFNIQNRKCDMLSICFILKGGAKLDNFEWYIKNVYKPAQDWYKNGGADWIEKYVDNHSWIMKNYDLVNPGVYKITLNDLTAYTGEAVKVSNRFVVHAWNLAKNPKRKFGVLPEEINNEAVRIKMICMENELHSNSEREQKEFEYKQALKPFLQKEGISDNGRNDLCIPEQYRREVTRRNLNL